MGNNKVSSKAEQLLFFDINRLIAESKRHVAHTVNTTLVILYWKIGKRIHTEILQHKRAEYGKGIVTSLAQQLTGQYGAGWDEKQLRHCIRSAETFSEKEILYAVSRQLSWTHLRTVMYLENELQREFYIQMAADERWSTRQLQERIDSMLFERTAISRKPKKVIKATLKAAKDGHEASPDLVFSDPYILDFLGLKDTYSEHDLEAAILRELETFILEIGHGFAFVARQKRMIIDGEDFKLDLLFFHRKLNRLVAIDLKLGKFKAAYKAQMELYLRWLEKNEMQHSEQTPLGLILCAEGNKEQIELLQLNKAGIKVAEYMTALPDKKLLKQKLHQAIEHSKNKINNL